MDSTQKQAVMTIALLAAFADGRNEEAERDQLRRVAHSLDASLNTPALMQDVLMGRASIATATAALTQPDVRRLAFELAVGVCEADGLRNESETRFLAELGRALGLDTPAIAEVAADADELATLPLAATSAGGTAKAVGSTDAAQDLDAVILNAAIVSGALELLPQTIASMAIIPLQLRLVHRIGRAYGVETDAAQGRELLATLGVGLAGQYVEHIARRMAGGLLGAVAGGLVGSLARGAAGAAMSFATTYAIGEVARRYYAGGRTMSTDLLKASFAELLARGRSLQARYVPQIEQQARELDPARLLQWVRNQ